jgi:hypothetical protein
MKGVVKTSGLEGVYESIEELASGRFVARYDFGLGTNASGFDGETPWSRDESGDITKNEAQSDVERARNLAYLASRGYWYPDRWQAPITYERACKDEDRTFHVLTASPEGGRPIEIWIDSDTLLMARLVEQGERQELVTRFDDYRQVHGLWVPHSIRTGEGNESYDAFVTISSIDINPDLSSSYFDIPEQVIADFQLADGVTSFSMPFELVNNIIFLKASVNGSEPKPFLADTGGVNLISRTVAAELGIRSEGKIQGLGAGEETVDVGMTRLRTFQLGQVSFRSPLFYVLSLENLTKPQDLDFAGIVGFELFKRFVVEIDYAESKLTLTLPEHFEYDGKGVIVPFTFDEKTPVVHGALDGVPGTFSIDTGSAVTVDVFRPFVDEHRLEDKYQPRFETIAGHGVGGVVRAKIARAQVLRIGDVEIPDVVIQLSTQEKGAYSDRYVAGNIGAGVFKRFTVVFDYANQRLIFEKNASFDSPEGHSRVGMSILRDADAFSVLDVIDGGPADSAGVEVGDRIIEIDGVSADTLRLPDLRRRFRTEPPGTVIRLTLDSKGRIVEAELTLEDLV